LQSSSSSDDDDDDDGWPPMEYDDDDEDEEDEHDEAEEKKNNSGDAAAFAMPPLSPLRGGGCLPPLTPAVVPPVASAHRSAAAAAATHPGSDSDGSFDQEEINRAIRYSLMDVPRDVPPHTSAYRRAAATRVPSESDSDGSAGIAWAVAASLNEKDASGSASSHGIPGGTITCMPVGLLSEFEKGSTTNVFVRGSCPDGCQLMSRMRLDHASHRVISRTHCGSSPKGIAIIIYQQRASGFGEFEFIPPGSVWHVATFILFVYIGTAFASDRIRGGGGGGFGRFGIVEFIPPGSVWHVATFILFVHIGTAFASDRIRGGGGGGGGGFGRFGIVIHMASSPSINIVLIVRIVYRASIDVGSNSVRGGCICVQSIDKSSECRADFRHGGGNHGGPLRRQTRGDSQSENPQTRQMVRTTTR
jgi:hypothetical protein